MEYQQTFTLIEGQFLAKESREILFSIYKSKMRFHRMKNFSSQERFGREDETALKRIPQLQETLEAISKMLDLAEKEGKSLEIKSQISVSFVDKN